MEHIEKNHSENNRNWRKRNKEKYQAQTKLNDAIKNGTIIKPLLCEKCNQEKPLQAHHEDYSKPLDIIWLCASCHQQLHKQKRIENGFEYKPIKVYKKKGYNNKGKMKPYKKPLYFEQAKNLRKEGKSYKKISQITGISKSQIYKWLNNTPYN